MVLQYLTSSWTFNLHANMDLASWILFFGNRRDSAMTTMGIHSKDVNINAIEFMFFGKECGGWQTKLSNWWK